MEQEELIVIDCTECPKGTPQMSSVQISKTCSSCPIINNRKYENIILKSKYFSKEYNENNTLQHINPFFLDVSLKFTKFPLEIVSEYQIPTGATVRIIKKPEEVGYHYDIIIPESDTSFSKLRELYKEVEVFKDTGLTENDLIRRWYLSYGIIEHLIFDDKVLEININPPSRKTAIRIVHEDYDECISNIYPNEDFMDYLETRLKISTGRPLNKAQPSIDGEIRIGNKKARVAATISPFSIFGPAFSIRKHRENPWTIPLFMKKQAVNGWFAGLMSLAITQGRAFLIAGPRGSGKTALLGSMLLDILPKYRIITIEDTQELPIESYKKLGYDILPLKVRSALLDMGMEIPFDTGLRTTLRLGDSCLIVGEIRSKEAKVLYEAMRVGAMSNVVAGTIHGDSPYGVYDRVVNDLGVPPGSFKVTDLIIIMNQIKSTTGLSRVRRVLSVTEVLKKWKSTDEPEFQDLLVYNVETDQLEPTEILLGGKSVFVQNILDRVTGYGSYDAVIQDIKLRAEVKEFFLNYAPSPEFLEAPYNAKANILYTTLIEKLNPLESELNYQSFKAEYLAGLFKLFKRKNV